MPATIKIGNSVDYAPSFLANDAVEGLRHFARGVIEAGHAAAALIADVAGEAAGAILDAGRGALGAGAIPGELLVESIRHPEQVLDNVLRAAEELGRTMRGVFANLIDRDEAVALAGLYLSRAVRLILEGAWEVTGGLLGLTTGILVNTVGTFRPLATSVRGDLLPVFGGSLDPDRVFIST